MRITDSRYDRDRQRLAVAHRLIAHAARTQTIRQATGLSGDRIRRLYRDYFKGQAVRPVRRRRGKSPRQMSFFRRSPSHELQAAALCALLRQCGFLGRPQVLYRPSLDEISRFCDVYDTFCVLCPATVITFEHAWHLLHVLVRLDEFVLARCPDCDALWVRDTLDLLPDNCAACRTAPPSN
jgi:Flagellar transcriptional activator (FlhC)